MSELTSHRRRMLLISTAMVIVGSTGLALGLDLRWPLVVAIPCAFVFLALAMRR